jgi:hypothetical protein
MRHADLEIDEDTCMLRVQRNRPGSTQHAQEYALHNAMPPLEAGSKDVQMNLKRNGSTKQLKRTVSRGVSQSARWEMIDHSPSGCYMRKLSIYTRTHKKQRQRKRLMCNRGFLSIAATVRLRQPVSDWPDVRPLTSRSRSVAVLGIKSRSLTLLRYELTTTTLVREIAKHGKTVGIPLAALRNSQWP